MTRMTSVLLAALLAALPGAGISLCVKGIAAEVCCEEENALSPDFHDEETSLEGTTCDCCFTVDALPFDRSAAGTKGKFGLVAVLGVSRVIEAPPAPPSTVQSSEFKVQRSLHALHTVVLLI